MHTPPPPPPPPSFLLYTYVLWKRIVGGLYTELFYAVIDIVSLFFAVLLSLYLVTFLIFLPAGYALCVWLAGPKITSSFHVCLCVFVCVSPLTMCTIITSPTLLPCDFTLVNLGNLDDCFVQL